MAGLCKATLVGLCRQLREDGDLTAGACGFTTWNGTLENLSGAHVNREARHVVAVTAQDDHEAESDEGTSCMAASRNHDAPKSNAFAMFLQDRSLTYTSLPLPWRQGWTTS